MQVISVRYIVERLEADPISPARGLKHLHRETFVPASVADTFAFFADASNLQRITPRSLDFKILTPVPVVMREGVEIDYRLRVHGFPIPWRSRIDVWEPAVRFVDRQIVGPYRWWHHDHRFEATARGTRVVDHVEYVARARWISDPIVSRDLHKIFAYRQAALRQVFHG
jgi:ligand-binding SRPBCC domain-containing protein